MRILFAPFAARAPSLGGRPSPKDYPWAKELGVKLQENHEVIQVGGSQDEQVAEDFRKNLSFPEVEELIKGSDTGICVDSYLQHHFWSVGRRAIVLFGISDPLIFGHSIHLNLLKDRSYLRPQQYDLYYTNQYCPEAFVSLSEILDALGNFKQISTNGGATTLPSSNP